MTGRLSGRGVPLARKSASILRFASDPACHCKTACFDLDYFPRSVDGLTIENNLLTTVVLANDRAHVYGR
jgi:hypothetical protein